MTKPDAIYGVVSFRSADARMTVILTHGRNLLTTMVKSSEQSFGRNLRLCCLSLLQRPMCFCLLDSRRDRSHCLLPTRLKSAIRSKSLSLPSIFVKLAIRSSLMRQTASVAPTDQSAPSLGPRHRRKQAKTGQTLCLPACRWLLRSTAACGAPVGRTTCWRTSSGPSPLSAPPMRLCRPPKQLAWVRRRAIRWGCTCGRRLGARAPSHRGGLRPRRRATFNAAFVHLRARSRPRPPKPQSPPSAERC